MNERHLQKITEHLKDEVAQERVRQNLKRIQNEATVTIGRAARLFGFSESQLRDWEKIGLLNPQRPKEKAGTNRTTSSGNSHSGQRQYTLAELDKLALIRELIDAAHMSPGAIPPSIDEIWRTITRQEPIVQPRSTRPLPELLSEEHDYIDRHVINSYGNLGWRYYVTRALWLSLMMIREDVPGYQAGIILPLQPCPYQKLPQDTEQLGIIGPALVGWWGQTRSFYTFLSQKPGFEYPSDYSVFPLYPEELYQKCPDALARHTLLIVVRGEEKRTYRQKPVVETIERLLKPIYEDRDHWTAHFGTGQREEINPNTNFPAKITDALLTRLTDMVVRLGGKHTDGEDRWNSCSVLLPLDPHLPLLRQTLIVQAKSRHSPMKVGISTAPPDRNATSLSQRAYQSGHIVSRSLLTPDDRTPLLAEIEGPIQSNIAIPIGAETGHPQGVLYVTSFYRDAFTIDDQRVLRCMARMLEELVISYGIRQQTSARMMDLLRDPGTVDPLFQEFAAETDLLTEIESLLLALKESVETTTSEGDYTGTRLPQGNHEGISFIALDIDTGDQERIAHSHGDQVLRKLYKMVGRRIDDLLPALFNNYRNCKLYHIYAGRYFILLHGLSLEKARLNGERLQKALAGNMTIKQSDLPGGTLVLPDITPRVVVTHYSSSELQNMLHDRQYTAVHSISVTIYNTLSSMLKLSVDRGDITVAWDPTTDSIIRHEQGVEN